jgi:hypothetical protein
MNLFRSEEHAKASSRYTDTSVDRTRPIARFMKQLTTGFHRQRLDPDYLIKYEELKTIRDANRVTLEDEWASSNPD